MIKICDKSDKILKELGVITLKVMIAVTYGGREDYHWDKANGVSGVGVKFYFFTRVSPTGVHEVPVYCPLHLPSYIK